MQKSSFMTAIFVLCMAGCSIETGGLSEEPTGELHEEIFQVWNDHGLGAATVGMAISGNNTYQWRNDGWVCRGSWAAPCSGTSYSYSYPGGASIVAIGIAKNTSHVYAWYSDSRVSRGTSDNLSFYAGKQTFAPPPGFAMNDLIEADNSSNGLWYYYWRKTILLPGGGSTTEVYRTTGTSVDADSSSGPALVTAGAPQDIVGIAFGTGHPASTYTFRLGGTVNISTSSANLSQP